MPLSIIVGGQYGSEGKGKTAFFFTKQFRAKAAVRVGGTNSGHTVVGVNGECIAFQILPTASLLNDVICVLPAGTYFYEDLLFDEIEKSHIDKERLFIDPHAVLISKDMKDAEALLMKSIGSTGSGTGLAVVSRISRNQTTYPFKFAHESEKLKSFIKDTKEYLRKMLDRDEHIVIEGTQGYGLSLLHSPFYPYITSRDTTAAGFLSETGLSPLDVENVIMVIRTYPIRVGGNSGPLIGETDWNTIKLESESNRDLTEYTTVTHKVRRVAEFDENIVNQAILVNKPNIIVLNHCDYIDSSVYQKTLLTDKVVKTIEQIETALKRKIDFIGTGENTLFSRRDI
jgi:adenylosuccinate synthase